MVFVTTYRNPDLDGVACSVAYAEFLRAQGIDARAGIFGHGDRETQFVMDKVGADMPEDAEGIVQECEAIVLTDTTEAQTISPAIDVEKVTEIIDHRAHHDAHRFPHVRIRIELVGAAATLVAERFRDAGITPSRAAATLLYCAIASHTINFRAHVTTERDRTIAQWLNAIAGVDDAFVHAMFRARSHFDSPAALERFLYDECAVFTLAGKVVGITQVEFVNVVQCIADHYALLTVFNAAAMQGKNKRNTVLDYAFVTMVDLDVCRNTFIATHAPSRALVEAVLQVTFDARGVAHYDDIIMRKEIVPRLEASLTKQ